MFATDFTLSDIDAFLKGLSIGPTGGEYPDNLGAVFIMERDGTLIGTSRGKSSFYPDNCKDVKPKRVKATQAGGGNDELVRRTAEQIQKRLGGFATDRFSATVGQEVSEITSGTLIVRANQINGVGKNLDWLSVVSLNHAAFFVPFDRRVQRAIVVSLGIAIVAGLLVMIISTLGSTSSSSSSSSSAARGGGTGTEEEGAGNEEAEEEAEDKAYDEDKVDEMDPFEAHEFSYTGVLPQRITQYYHAMRKVLQAQVDMATLNIPTKTPPPNQDPSTVFNSDEDPTVEELEMALTTMLSTSTGHVDATKLLWFRNWAPRWIRTIARYLYTRRYGTLYSLILVLHCFWAFVEAPTGRGFSSGMGVDVNIVLAVSGLCILAHGIDNILWLSVNWVSQNKLGIRLTAVRLSMVILMFVEWVWQVSRASPVVAEIAARQGMKQACFETLGPTGRLAFIDAAEGPTGRRGGGGSGGGSGGEGIGGYFTGLAGKVVEVLTAPSTGDTTSPYTCRAFTVPTNASLRQYLYPPMTVDTLNPLGYTAGSGSGSGSSSGGGGGSDGGSGGGFTVFEDCLLGTFECVQYCANNLPRPVPSAGSGGSGQDTFLGCAASAVAARLNGTLSLKDLQPDGPGLLVNNILIMLGYTALLRPLLAVARIDSLRRALMAFTVTLKKAGSIFVVFGLLLVIATVQGITLFYNRGLGFSNLGDAFVTVFIFMISAENYPDEVRHGDTEIRIDLCTHTCIHTCVPTCPYCLNFWRL